MTQNSSVTQVTKAHFRTEESFIFRSEPNPYKIYIFMCITAHKVKNKNEFNCNLK
jgi:hypothetical protein